MIECICSICRAPALDVSGILHMRPPPPEKIRAAMTQAEMTAVSVPVLEGAEVDANFKVRCNKHTAQYP